MQTFKKKNIEDMFSLTHTQEEVLTEGEKTIPSFLRASPRGGAKITGGNRFFIIHGKDAVKPLPRDSQQSPGTVLGLDGDTLTVDAGTGDTAMRGIASLHGDVVRHEAFWVRRLAGLRPLSLVTGDARNADADTRFTPIDRGFTAWKWFSPPTARGDRGLCEPAAAFFAFLASIAGVPFFDIGYTDSRLLREVNGLDGLFANRVPLRIRCGEAPTFTGFCRTVRTELKRVEKHRTYIRDIFVRYPHLASIPDIPYEIGVALVDGPEETAVPPTSQFQLILPLRGNEMVLCYNALVLDEETVDRFIRHFSQFIRKVNADPAAPMLGVPIV